MEASENAHDLKAKLNDISNSYKSLLLQTHNKALLQNAIQTKRWEDYKNEHVDLCDRLMSLRDNLSHPIMVPIGKKALMRGCLVHTNEIMVCLGDGWFAKQSSKQAADICQRRIQHCDGILNNLKKEEELLNSRKSFPFENEAFIGDDQTQEIIEPFDEEEEKQWREKHRQKEKEYRKKLAELKRAPKAKIESEEDIWSRLDALDKQEELEDELNRLDVDIEDEEDDSGSEDDSDSDDETCEVAKQSGKNSLRRRVSFKGDEDSCGSEQKSDSDENISRIVFSHSDIPVSLPLTSSGEIITPSDIYLQYLKHKAPKSILKPSLAVNHLPAEHEEEKSCTMEGSNNQDYLPMPPVESAVKAVGDQVLERTVDVSAVPEVKRPVSKFKAARMASKR